LKTKIVDGSKILVGFLVVILVLGAMPILAVEAKDEKTALSSFEDKVK
jgi:hypothetical protein